MIRLAWRRIIQFSKTNSKALIIGASLIIGLNLDRFTNYAAGIPRAISLAIYQLSGQAEADKAQGRQAVAQREHEEQARYERLRVEAAAWEKFLTAVRPKFSQINVINNSYGGDFVCLRTNAAEEVSHYQVRDGISDAFVQWLNGNGLLHRYDWTYDDLRYFADTHYVGCSSAKDVWRANRYNKRLD